MNYFYFDPSALIKRYHVELGTENVDYLLDNLLAEHPVRITTSVWSIPETIAALNRHKNERRIPETQFSILLLSFLYEARNFEILNISEDKLFRSIDLILQHNLNSADALHLVSIQDASEVVSLAGNNFIVVVSDKRFLRAARREGFTALNPEDTDTTEIDRLILE
ncbi:type II toxin-antitoxin system VapC family toxin [bacterium]|nr:type II toxin-antitoxin system VapC family toxin [bacterium]